MNLIILVIIGIINFTSVLNDYQTAHGIVNIVFWVYLTFYLIVNAVLFVSI